MKPSLPAHSKGTLPLQNRPISYNHMNREKTVLELLNDVLCYKTIIASMEINYFTVYAQILIKYEKLLVNSSAETIYLTLNSGVD